MTVRPDVAARNAGPRFGIVPPEERYQRSLDASDPDTPHCWSCGTPARPDNPLVRYQLGLHARGAGSWQLCDGCYRFRNPPPTQAEADPLGVA